MIRRSLVFLFFLGILPAVVLTAQTAGISAEVVPSILAPGETAEVRVTIEIPEDRYQNLQEEFLGFSLLEPRGTVLGPVIYPPGEDKGDRIVYHGALILTAPLTYEGGFPGERELKFLVEYQLCDEDGVCFFPQSEEISLTVTLGEEPSGGTGRLFLFLLFALIGGLLLNIMPCVLPVLTLKAFSLLNNSEDNPGEQRTSGLLYAAGVISSLLILAVVVIVLKLAGEQVGWGFQFQNPVFILTLVVILFLFSLSLFEVFIINPPGTNTAARLSGKGGRWGAFLSGAFAVLLATPCTAPFLGTALGFAFTQSPLVILLIFFMVGLGLSLPFLILGFFPRLIRLLPRPGNWMNRFRELMAFLLMGTAVHFVAVLREQIGGARLVGVIEFLFVLAVAAWLLGWLTKPAHKKPIRLAGALLALTLAFGGGFFFLDLTPVSAEESLGPKIPAGWERFSPEAVEEAIISGDPVFIAFGASWCLTCKTNEATVLMTDWGNRFFEERNIRRFYGDFTNNDTVIGEWIADYGRAGVPVYAYYSPGTGTARILPELLNRPLFEEALR